MAVGWTRIPGVAHNGVVYVKERPAYGAIKAANEADAAWVPTTVEEADAKVLVDQADLEKAKLVKLAGTGAGSQDAAIATALQAVADAAAITGTPLAVPADSALTQAAANWATGFMKPYMQAKYQERLARDQLDGHGLSLGRAETAKAVVSSELAAA